jgi:mono/diheme cytochrome c family protein
MLRPMVLIIFLMSCDNHRYQASLRPYENGAARIAPEGAMRIHKVEPRPVVDPALLKFGQSLYQVNCIVCHDAEGSGHGIMTHKGFPVMPAFEKKGPEFSFNVMTKGHEKMPSFQRRLTERERWAVAAYVEALIISRKISLKDLDPQDREKLP